MACKNKDCYYYSGSTETCDYYLITGVDKGCSSDECTKYRVRISKDEKKKQWSHKYNVTSGEARRLTKEEGSIAAMYYRDGLFDSEIARNMGVHPNSIINWRRRLGLKSNYNKLIYE